MTMNLSQGATFTASGTQFQISYQAEGATFDAGVDGNNIMLQVVPEPGSFPMILGGFGILLGFQRARRCRA